jgi:serine protease
LGPFFYTKYEGHMNVLKITSAALAIVLIGLSAQAKNRYVVIYKSNQGFTAMNTFMKLESSKTWGMKKSLKFVNGMIFESSDAASMERLKNHPEVALVEKEIIYALPKPIGSVIVKPTQSSIRQAVVSGDPALFSTGEKTPWGIGAVKAPAAWKLSADAGSQSRVLILDTGLDTNHPALSTNFEKGLNFTGWFGTDSDITDEVGHGTHCSGTAVGLYNETTGFAGVAPQAKLLMGKVCDTMGCSSVAVTEGINWGVQEKVDVISMSLGGATGSSAEKMALEAAEKAGVFVVAASGNSAVTNPDGSITTPGVSYPAAFPTAFAVGAIDSQLIKSSFSNWGPELDIVAPGSEVLSSIPVGSGRESLVEIVISGQKTVVKSSRFTGATDISQTLTGTFFNAGLGKPTDFTADAAGKIALISRGDITFGEKIKNAMAAKAIGAIVYNNAPGLINATLIAEGEQNINFAAAMIEQIEGLKIVEALNLKVDAAAEMSTLKTDYAFFNGTSMATPHVAGVAALVISAYKSSHGGKSITPAALRTLLKATAAPLTPNDNNEYGSGNVQADAAVAAAIAAP